MERDNQKNAYKLNASVSYVPKTENPLDDAIDIIDDHIEHKKTTHPTCLRRLKLHPLSSSKLKQLTMNLLR